MQIPPIQSSIDSQLAPRVCALLLLLAQVPTTYAAVYKCAAKDGSTTYSDMPCEQNAQAIQVTSEPLHTAPKSTTENLAPGNAQINQAQEQMATLCERANYDAWYRTQNPKPTPEQTNTKLRDALQACRATLAHQSSAIPATHSAPSAAQDKSARETKASLCSTRVFNEWIRTQGHPLPDPNIRVAKLMEISNQCRRPLGLPDMTPPAPIAAPKPILQGPAGEAAAAHLTELVKSGSIERLQKYLSSPGVDINDRAGTDEALRFTILGGPNQLEDRKQMIELLLGDGADIDNRQPGLDVIPVMLAPTPEMAEFLFAHGANKKAKLSGAQLARWFVCNNSGKDPIGTLQVVVDHGINIGGTTPNGDSALPCATHANNAALAAFLQAHQVGGGRSQENSGPTPRSAIAAAQEAQLHPKRTCVRLDSTDNSHTPMELYSALNDCMQNNRDTDAVSLFALAGMDSAFDSLRVSDKTAGQARQILLMDLFQRMPADVHARFETATKNLAADAPRHAALCEQVKKAGPPQYFPAYMVNHGLGVMQSALSNQAPPAPLEPNFDAAAAWRELLTNYLNCGGTVAPKPLH